MRVITTVLGGLLLCLLLATGGGAQHRKAVAVGTGDAARTPARAIPASEAEYQQTDVSLSLGEAQPARPRTLDSAASADTSASAAAPLLFEISWHTINGGGARVSGSGFVMDASVAQTAVGVSSAGSYEAGAGYWYAGEPDTSGCSCPCHADPQCDVVTNVLDVVSAVNVAFRGWMPMFDSGCPYERTDVDCSGFTNVIDVVKFVNVAFRGGNPVIQFCNPCPP